MAWGSLFHSVGAATVKLRNPEHLFGLDEETDRRLKCKTLVSAKSGNSMDFTEDDIAKNNLGYIKYFIAKNTLTISWPLLYIVGSCVRWPYISVPKVLSVTYFLCLMHLLWGKWCFAIENFVTTWKIHEYYFRELFSIFMLYVQLLRKKFWQWYLFTKVKPTPR